MLWRGLDTEQWRTENIENMPRPSHGGHTVMGGDNEASADSRE